MKLIFPTLIQVSAPEQFVVRDDYTFAINMKTASPMGLDTVALSNNAILDPDLVKSHATTEDPWATEWLKRNTASIGPYTLVKNEPGRRDRDGGDAELLAPEAVLRARGAEARAERGRPRPAPQAQGGGPGGRAARA
jgi:hypothetical protein